MEEEGPPQSWLLSDQPETPPPQLSPTAMTSKSGSEVYFLRAQLDQARTEHATLKTALQRERRTTAAMAGELGVAQAIAELTTQQLAKENERSAELAGSLADMNAAVEQLQRELRQQTHARMYMETALAANSKLRAPVDRKEEEYCRRDYQDQVEAKVGSEHPTDVKGNNDWRPFQAMIVENARYRKTLQDMRARISVLDQRLVQSNEAHDELLVFAEESLWMGHELSRLSKSGQWDMGELRARYGAQSVGAKRLVQERLARRHLSQQAKSGDSPSKLRIYPNLTKTPPPSPAILSPTCAALDVDDHRWSLKAMSRMGDRRSAPNLAQLFEPPIEGGLIGSWAHSPVMPTMASGAIHFTDTERT